jgi:FkbM family methyltransferase
VDVIDNGEKRALDAIVQSWDYMASLPLNAGRVPVVFDVGANRGYYTEEVLRRFLAARIYCFEPQPSAAALLRDRFSEGVRVFDFGLSTAEGERTLRSSAAEACVLATLSDRDADVHDGSVKLSVQEKITLRRLDNVVEDLRVPKISLLKIDTEGHDFDVLMGAGRLLDAGARIDFIQFEFNATTLAADRSFRGFWDLLHDDYVIWRLETDGSARLIADYSEAEEARTPQRNYLAVNRGFVWFEFR